MHDSRPKGRGFEPHRRHCVVSLSKNINPSLVLVQPRKTRPFITKRLLMGRKETNQTNEQKNSYGFRVNCYQFFTHCEVVESVLHVVIFFLSDNVTGKVQASLCISTVWSEPSNSGNTNKKTLHPYLLSFPPPPHHPNSMLAISP